MSKNAKHEKDLKRIQQRLQILAPIIQDANNSCFNLGKFFVTILIAIHGGAIGILVTSNDETVMDSIAYFIIGIVFSLILAFIMMLTVSMTVSQYRKSIFEGIFNINKSVKSINISKNILYIMIYFLFILSFSLFFIGVKEITYIKFRINISEIIKQNIAAIIYPIRDITVMAINFIDPFCFSLFITICIIIFSYKKYKSTIVRAVNTMQKKVSNIINFAFSFVRRRLITKQGVIAMKNNENTSREYLEAAATDKNAAYTSKECFTSDELKNLQIIHELHTKASDSMKLVFNFLIILNGMGIATLAAIDMHLYKFSIFCFSIGCLVLLLTGIISYFLLFNSVSIFSNMIKAKMNSEKIYIFSNYKFFHFIAIIGIFTSWIFLFLGMSSAYNCLE